MDLNPSATFTKRVYYSAQLVTLFWAKKLYTNCYIRDIIIIVTKLHACPFQHCLYLIVIFQWTKERKKMGSRCRYRWKKSYVCTTLRTQNDLDNTIVHNVFDFTAAAAVVFVVVSIGSPSTLFGIRSHEIKKALDNLLELTLKIHYQDILRRIYTQICNTFL